jgi:hypothetical protein
LKGNELPQPQATGHQKQHAGKEIYRKCWATPDDVDSTQTSFKNLNYMRITTALDSTT